MNLFDPIRLRGAALANRLVVSPMCQYSAIDGRATDWHLVHWAQLMMSGAGMFTIEATAVTAQGRISPGDFGLYDDACENALTQTLARARAQCPPMPVALQLAHAGRKGSSHVPWEGGHLIPVDEGGWITAAPSSIPHASGEPAPAALDDDGLARVRDAFANSARRAVRAGIDALELHMAHGYLLHEFLSPLANHRSDRYGGSFEGRVRFPLEVFDAVRAAWPKRQAARSAPVVHRLDRRRMDARRVDRIIAPPRGARLRFHRRVERWHIAGAEDSARSRLSGRLRARDQARDRRDDGRRRADHDTLDRRRRSSPPAMRT